MSYVYPFWRRQNQDRPQRKSFFSFPHSVIFNAEELDSRTASTASTDVDATDLVNHTFLSLLNCSFQSRSITRRNEFELKEISHKEVEKGHKLENLIIQSKGNKEMDQEQVFEDLTIHCTPFQHARRASLENHKTDESKEEIPVEGALGSAESSKKEGEISDSADFIDQELGESEVS